MPYRPYQSEMHEASIKAYDAGIHLQLISAATGTGKTQTFAGIPDVFRSRLPGQMLVLAHREELIDQGIKKIKEVNPHLTVTKEMAGDIGDVNADVIVGSVATLGNKNSVRGERFPWHNIDKIITDEAHHATSDTYRTVYSLADVLRPDTHKLHLGVTATPQRADGKALAEIFKRIIYEYSLRRAVEEGYLVEPHGIRIKTNTSLSEAKSSNGDYSASSLAAIINNPERNQLVVKAWLDHGQNRRTIGFTADIQHALDLVAMFKYYGVKAEAIWGDDPERKAKIARHQSGETTILLNCGVLTEGYDDPAIGCILLARPTKSGVLYCQMVGRGTRLFIGKTDCIVIDVVDSTAKNSLLTLPTLLGLSTTLDLKGRGVLWAARQLEEAAKDYPQIDFSKLVDIDSITSHIESVNLFEVKFPEEVQTNSELTWYTSPTGGYILKLPGEYWQKDKVTIDQNLLDKWEVIGDIKGLRYRGERDTMEEAFRAADKLIDDKIPEALNLLKQKAGWHDRPATEPQKKAIKRYYPGRAIPHDLTNGAASRLIGLAKARK